MFALLETAIAFSAAMLAVSLFISAAVQWIAGLGRYRATTLADMLRSLIHGFRVFHNDADAVSADQPDATAAQKQACRDCEMTFVNDVLSDPVLHARSTKLAYQDNPAALARQIDYIDEQDLVALAYNIATNPAHGAPALRGQAGSRSIDDLSPVVPMVEAVRSPMRIREIVAHADTPGVNLLLPAAWVGGTADTPKEYASTANFAAYVGRWFSTVEGPAAQHYKSLIRRLTFVVAALAVVVFNIDSIHILSDLHRNTTTRAAIVGRIDDLQTVAARIAGSDSLPPAEDASMPAPNSKVLLLDMQKSLALLSESGLSVGWKDSWIVKRLCTYRGLCADPQPPSLGQLTLDVLGWLGGLLFTCVLLSLGAPFWVNTLTRLINLKNEVQQRKESEASKDGSGDSSFLPLARGLPAPRPAGNGSHRAT
jgi:hypothetical protein